MSKPILEANAVVPLYRQLMEKLQKEITSGILKPGDRLLPEVEMAKYYQVSVITARKAMDELAAQGLIEKKQGKGTFVADERIQRDLLQITSFSAACRQNGHCAGTKVISAGLEEASQEDVEHLGAAPGGQVVEICRLRLCDGEPVMLEFNRFPDRYAFLLDEALDGSLYDLLRQRGIVPTSAVHDISLGHATPMVSRHLGTAQGDALLLLNELVMDQHGQPLHSSRQWIRGDKYTFRI